MAAKANSATPTKQTPTDDAGESPEARAARVLSDAGKSATPQAPSEADVVEEAPGTPKPPPRVAQVTLDAVLGGVFDGAARDPERKRSANRADAETAEPGEAPPKKKKGRPAKAVQTEQEKAEAVSNAKAEAEGIVRMFDQVQQIGIRSKLKARNVDPVLVEGFAAKLAFTDAEVEIIAAPLAEGMAESGVELPWWARLGFAAGMVLLPRSAMISDLMAELDARDGVKTDAKS